MSDRASRLLRITTLLVGGVLFCALFANALRSVPAANYTDRDDAVITLSHARNLVDFGFIGVSPSGERVEGFSAPLQFWVAAAAYAMAPYDYHTFFEWQTWAGTFLLGVVIAGLLFPVAGVAHVNRVLLMGAGLMAIAATLSSLRAFLLWHASGMENVYKSVALAGLLWAFCSALPRERVSGWLSPAIAVAALSRIDAIVPVGVLSAAFAALHCLRFRRPRTLAVVAGGMGLWAAYMAWRFSYFGQWAPNTALAQAIDPGARLAALVQAPVAAVSDVRKWLADTGGSLGIFHFLWLPVVLALARGHRSAVERTVLLCAGAAACVLQYVLFGPARMDNARTVPELALYSVLLVPMTLAGRTSVSRRIVAAGAAMLAVSTLFAVSRPPDRDVVGWGAQDFEPAIERIGRLAHQHDIPRPLVANPDLGALSWHKQFNVLDLGMLGSAIVARLDRPAEYLMGYAKPDVIELHGIWSCKYQDLFTNPTFLAEYTRADDGEKAARVTACGSASDGEEGVWLRRAVLKESVDVERRFLDALRADMRAERIRKEIATCVRAVGPSPCGYVGRTLFGFVPELEHAGLYTAVADMLSKDSRLEVAHAYFTSAINPRWWRTVAAAAEPPSVEPSTLTIAGVVGAVPPSARVNLRNTAQVPWRLHTPTPDGLRVSPLAGTGPAVLTVEPRGMTTPSDVSTALTITLDGVAAISLPIRIRALPNVAGSPFGSVDVPADPLAFDGHGIEFQGWALDELGIGRVVIEYADSHGVTRELATIRPTIRRPPITKAFPDAANSATPGWLFGITSDDLSRLPRPGTFRFTAEAVDGRRATIGTRTLR